MHRLAEQLAKTLRTICHKRPKKIGIEIERIAMWSDGSPFLYFSRKNKNADQLLKELSKRYGWGVSIENGGNWLALKTPYGKLSLEPGSQLEFSSIPYTNLNDLQNAVRTVEQSIEAVTKPWGLHWVALGVHPTAQVSDIDIIPLERYQIMNDYLGRPGGLGTSMMRLTSSVQMNFDYGCDDEGGEYFKVSSLLTPLSYALFANSPYTEGHPSEFLSFRSEIWRYTDPDRSGICPWALEDGFTFEKYAEHLINLPLMFFEKSPGDFIRAEGASLKTLMSNQTPNQTQILTPIQQLFTESRLKPGYLEIRNVDGLTPSLRYAATAFWMGVLYSPKIRKYVIENSKSITFHSLNGSWLEASKKGLSTVWNGATLRDWAQRLLPMIKEELTQRGQGEEKFLWPIECMVKENKNHAQLVLEKIGPNPGKKLQELFELCLATDVSK